MNAGMLQRGFTLIELSIVLVIIGLIVGGVLVGQDLIRAATIRAQITQIEKFKSAANTFFGKYGALPGDIPPRLVSQFGFTASSVRAGTPGQGDGNGELDGISGGGSPYCWDQSGENIFFWEDLSINSGLIAETVASAPISMGGNCTTASACSVYFPAAKTGNGNVVYAYSGYAKGCCTAFTNNGPNFFGLSVINSITDGNVGNTSSPSAPGLTVMQAYTIDMKIDDGSPTTGNVLAQYLGNGGVFLGAPTWSPSAASPGSSTCFDTTSGNYSVTQNNGTNVNCALSFKMQAGD